MKTLFDMTTLGHRTLKNRVWRSATWLSLADAEGNVTDELVSAYEELAAGGAAVIVTGLTSVVAVDAEIDGGVKFYDDRFISGHRRLTDVIHRHSLPSVFQTAPLGQGRSALVMMQTAIVDGPIDQLTTEQVEDIVHQFGNAAARAEQAGYDGVQIDTKIEYVSLSRPLIREPNLIRRWQAGDTAPSKCVSCNSCYRTPGHQCIFNLKNKQ